MSDHYVKFGDIARRRLGQQCQYASRYTGIALHGDGVHGSPWQEEARYPDLGKGLRFKGNQNNYHSLEIHEDDVEEFVRRYKEYREKQMNSSWEDTGYPSILPPPSKEDCPDE